MSNPLTFLRQIRAELLQIVWPTRNETMITTIMVVILAIAASVFFFLADQVLNWIVTTALRLRG